MDSRSRGAEPVREVGGYRLLRVLGSGGMGTVYEALDAEERTVALKLLHPAFSVDEEARERLRREVATLHRVRGDHVARVLDAEVDSAEAFVVTELIDGQSLEESIAEHGPMDAVELADLADGLARALDSIHGVGVMHRDLKPGNVMLTDDGPVVIDFGISQLADDPRLTSTGLVTGTPGYVSPEVLRGGAPGVDGDWWGWAALLVHAATGRPPFGRGPGVLPRVESGRVDVDGLHPRVAQVLRRALHPDPERRMRPDVVRRALDDHAEGREVTALLDDPSAADPGGASVAPARVDGGPDHPADRPPTFAPGRTRHPDDRPATAVMPQSLREQYPPTRQAPVPPPAAPPPTADPTPGPDPGSQVPWSTHHGAGSAQPGDPQTVVGRPDLGALDPRTYSADPARQPPHPGQADGWPGPPAHGHHDQVGGPGPVVGPGDEAWPAWAQPARARPGITLSWWFACVALGLLWPAWMLLGFVAVVVVLGTVGSTARALRNRRLRRGPGRWDLLGSTLSAPAHLVLATLLAVPGVIVGGLGAVIVWGLASATAPMPAVLAAAVGVATLLCWWTPSSTHARHGARSVLDVFVPGPATTWIWIVAALAVAAVALVAVAVGDVAPTWAPFSEPPIPQF